MRGGEHFMSLVRPFFFSCLSTSCETLKTELPPLGKLYFRGLATEIWWLHHTLDGPMLFRRLKRGDALRSYCCSLRLLNLASEARDTLTKQLGALKEECKGQGLDLADMNDASRTAMRSLQEGLKRANIDDESFKGKCTTLSASLKAYTSRLTNLQNEARSIQAEADALLRLIWGTEAATKPASFASPPCSTETPVMESEKDETRGEGSDFDVEPPKIVEVLSGGAPAVEKVEAERVMPTEDMASRNHETQGKCVEEIEVETIEVEVEPQESPADTMKITDITKELYEKGVNFSDCLDAQSLRQRYRDVLSGRIPPGIQAGSTSKKPLDLEMNKHQPRMPSNNSHTNQRQYQQQNNTTESGIAHDPYPNAYRKMVDPMKHVWELKNELAAEKGIDPSSVDLWSGKTKLEDHKMLYDYPSVQSYPIEVRQRGDIPR
ncbi:hypothetical protein, conserved [Trypanosoma brucei gambiense DAL972]|nr:hypothetical protein, conserved [Trypanosoma brucei gambiense DAL972]CBH13937.1 hypothetical protein, conserved [Trypanosoma brucei gambiense DAL972]|eukprot:XP_011776211.1 hypothetical protein, conserved [Trypanosoma brucei gambiense DAL972]